MARREEETALDTHLATGHTTVARAWAVERQDGVRLGFTDHDRDFAFEGVTFRAGTGLSARALQQGTGLSVDNSEAMGALSDPGVTESDIAAGRYDDARVTVWLVNWANVAARRVLFRGHIGEIRRAEGAFHAELRGLSERLNRPLGRVYQKSCTAVLGDASCRADLGVPGYAWEGPVTEVASGRRFVLGPMGGFDPDWFARGALKMLGGPAEGLGGAIKRDRMAGDLRVVELWEPVRADIVAGDPVRIVAGCDKRLETCRLKFDNILNFQGFPDIPGEDWLMVHPTGAKALGGGSRR
ncbi:DUF2163 domain-containing protein [Roseivivax isoporae]|uniref:Gene transfer agent protein n=1 Tax=Roseivivax isoporae LMG 25204 TaxID=1449351 RepID=X7F824_9RHOB|nr:DUF2163 domain-containing protein [Roseivivax isoporae]ETX28251.1 gene transfer agent protein [Roseivivax isoporae LMG 25204]